MTFFFRRSTENSEKSRPTQKLSPLQKNNNKFCPLEQRSNCGTGATSNDDDEGRRYHAYITVSRQELSSNSSQN